MKRLIVFVCLFFFSISIYGDEIDDLDTIEKEIDIVDIESTSKQLNEIYKELYKKEKEFDIQLKVKEEYQNREEKGYQYCDNQIDSIYQEMSLNLCLYQISRWNDFDCQRYNDLYYQRNICKKKKERLYKDIQSISIQKENIQKDMKRVEALQNRLLIRFNQRNVKEQGSPNPYHTIQGVDDLPIYGGPSDSNDSKISCLSYGNYQIDETSDTWFYPIQGGYVSAGTWAYPDGGMHLGMDIAVSMYSNLYAPLNGIVLYADACTDSDNGYLGNWVGWPLGGGNTICMIGSYQNQLYALSFCHLSNEIFVYPGQQVRQGDLLALSGNSGNSTGPHCHIEVFTLQCSMEEAISYFINTSDFTFGNGYNAPATCSNYACRIQPESVWG